MHNDKENKNFNKYNCFSNIRELINENPSIKIGMIEKEAGVQPGYMSRLEKEDNMSEPSMEFIITAAKIFGVTVDMLISGNIEGLNGNERFILKFIDTLIKDTINADITWDSESPKELENTYWTNDVPQHILMKKAEYWDLDKGGYPKEVEKRAEFNSLFFNDNYRIKLMGNVYHIELPQTDTTVYIAYIGHSNSTGIADMQYEIQVKQNHNITGLCGSCQSAKEIGEKIRKLYEIIDEMNSGIGLNSEIKDTLNYYMTLSSPSAKKERKMDESLFSDESPFI